MSGRLGFSRLPLFWLSLCMVVGVWLSSLLGGSPALWVALAAGCLALLVLPWLFRWAAVNRPGVIRAMLDNLPQAISQNAMKPLVAPVQDGHTRLVVVVSLCILALALGAARYQLAQPDITPEQIAWYNDLETPAEVQAVVVKPPDVRDAYVQLILEAVQITPEGGSQQPVSGLLLARLPAGGAWQYGDQVRLWGMLETPPEDEEFSYKDYLARQQIYSYMPFAAGKRLEQGRGNAVLAWIYGLRARGLVLVYQYLPDPEASLLAGIVLGVESGIPDQVEQDFRDTGTTHIIAISGFNITIVSALVAALFGRLLGPRRGAVAAVLSIGLYTILVGGDAPVVRAAIMGGLSLFARQVGRRQHGLNSLAFTAAVMLLANPLLLWDAGFQLSFAATLGLVLYAEPWSKAFEGWLKKWMQAAAARRVSSLASEYLLLTVAAQLTTLPILAYHFHRISLISLPANLAILPAQPPVMVVGGLAVLLGIFAPAAGQLLAYATWPFIAYTIRVVGWFAGLAQGVLSLGWFQPAWVLVFYAVLLGITFNWDQIKEKMKEKRSAGGVKPALLLVGLLVLTVLVWQMVLSAPDGLLRVTFLDVGDGEAVLVQTPEGRYVLIGGGDSSVQLSYGLGRALPLFHRKLDLLVVAGTQTEQLDALPEVVERFTPAQVWWSGEPGESRPGRELYAWAREVRLPLERMQAGQTLELGQGARLEVLHVGQGGATLMLSWNGFQCLLPIGTQPVDLKMPVVVQAAKGATVMLLPGSGEADLNPADWLSSLSLNTAVISVDALNRYGLPSPETLDALQGTQMLRTDTHGWIEFTTDGDRLWVEVERE